MYQHVFVFLYIEGNEICLNLTLIVTLNGHRLSVYFLSCWCTFQIGSYDPLSDDPQLGIQGVVLNSSDETLFVAGTTGHVVILHFAEDERRREIEVHDCRPSCLL